MHDLQVAMKHSPFPEKLASLLAFQAKMFHVKRRLVQENETRKILRRRATPTEQRQNLESRAKERAV
jgi:hypothetical protein